MTLVPPPPSTAAAAPATELPPQVIQLPQQPKVQPPPPTSIGLSNSIALPVPGILQNFSAFVALESALFSIAVAVRLGRTALRWLHSALTWRDKAASTFLCAFWCLLCLKPWQLYLYAPAVLLALASLMTLVGWSVLFGPMELEASPPPVTATTVVNVAPGSSSSPLSATSPQAGGAPAEEQQPNVKIGLNATLDDLAAIKDIVGDLSARAKDLVGALQDLATASSRILTPNVPETRPPSPPPTRVITTIHPGPPHLQDLAGRQSPQQEQQEVTTSVKLNYVQAQSISPNQQVLKTVVDPLSNPYSGHPPPSEKQDVVTAVALLGASVGWVVGHAYGIIRPSLILLVGGLFAIAALSDAFVFCVRLSTDYIVTSSPQWRRQILNLLIALRTWRTRLPGGKKAAALPADKPTAAPPPPPTTLAGRVSASAHRAAARVSQAQQHMFARLSTALRLRSRLLAFTLITKLLSVAVMVDNTVKEQRRSVREWEEQVEQERRTWAGVEIEPNGIGFVMSADDDGNNSSDRVPGDEGDDDDDMANASFRTAATMQDVLDQQKQQEWLQLQQQQHQRPIALGS
ncbi:hypothetical protein RI367_005789 [Sorochytrium milnesiophthora]